jgi:predicted nucleic acid-binding protein
MRVLLDTDVILDFPLDRKPFFQAASELLELNANGSFDAYISSITPINVFYIGRKVVGASKIRQGIDDLLRLVRVTAVDQSSLIQALGLPFADYEDAVQHTSASNAGLDAIVTRNLDDYKSATLKVYSPTEFLDHLQLHRT